MKRKFLWVLSLVLALIILIIIFHPLQRNPIQQNNQTLNVTPTNNLDPNLKIPGPSTIIYKTNAGYYGLVPVVLSSDKSKAIMYPNPKSIYQGGKIPYPTRLDKGYLLANLAISPKSAFLDTTYADYANLSSTPNSTEIYNMILVKSPFTEMYDCGNRTQYSNGSEIQNLNNLIDSKKLSNCEKLI